MTTILTSGPELSTQRATAESSPLLLADFPFPGPRSFSEDESPETLGIIISFIITSSLMIFYIEELLLQKSSPATIQTEGWVIDWVDRALDMTLEGCRLSSLNKPQLAIDPGILFSAAEALMVCLLGQTIKITGGNILCHIPGLAFLVEIMLLVLCLVINIPPRLLVVGEELRWRGGERACSIWLSSRCPFNGTSHTGLMANKDL